MNVFVSNLFETYYQESPLVLVDIGARGGLNHNWRPARKHLNVVAFEPDHDEYGKLRKTASRDFIYLLRAQ